MTTDIDPEGSVESGGALREKLEESNADNKVLRDALAATAAERYQFVTPEDLRDVAPGDLNDRAKAIESERTEQRQTVLNEELKARGLSDEQVGKIVGKLAGASSPPNSALEQLGNIGDPVGRPKPGTQDGLYGPDRIRAAMGD